MWIWRLLYKLFTFCSCWASFAMRILQEENDSYSYLAWILVVEFIPLLPKWKQKNTSNMFSTVVYLIGLSTIIIFAYIYQCLLDLPRKDRKWHWEKKTKKNRTMTQDGSTDFPTLNFSATPLFWSSPLFFLSSTSLVLSLSPFFRKTQAG